MPIRIGSNSASLSAQRRLGDTTAALAASYDRLASGIRINKPSDDAAGLSVVASLNVDTRVFGQAIKNLNDGISLLNIAEGALLQLSSIATRQEELAEQAANGVYGLKQRQALQAEAGALTNEFNRIVESTKYNGINLLDGTLSEGLRVQGGYGLDGGLTVSVGHALSRTVGTGAFQPVTVLSVGSRPDDVEIQDYNRDGLLDIAVTNQDSNSISILIGNGDGSFKNQASYASSNNAFQFSSQDINHDGLLDIVTASNSTASIGVMLGNGDGSFKSSLSFASLAFSWTLDIGDISGDGHVDVVNANVEPTGVVSVHIGNGDGTFRAYTSYAVGNNPGAVALRDINGDSLLDMLVTGAGSDSLGVLVNKGDGTFFASRTYGTGDAPSGLVVFDADRDGFADVAIANLADDSISLLLGNGDGSFRAHRTFSAGDKIDGLSLQDINGDGFEDIVGGNNDSTTLTVVLGNGDGSFKAMSTPYVGDNPWVPSTGDLNRDGAPDVVAALFMENSIGILLAEVTKNPRSPALNLLTPTSAREALDTARSTRERVSEELGVIGAAQSRFAIAVRNLETQRENYQRASSRIVDADVADESARLVSNDIRQQAAAAILSQANNEPALALRLLGD